VTGVVLTHGHPDHVGGLAAVIALAPRAAVWGSARESYQWPVRAIADGDTVRGLRGLETPGHTPGHVSLLAEDWGALLMGEVLGTQAGRLVRPPANFTTDAAEAERSLRRLAGLAAERMLFAHGQEIDRPTEAFRQFLQPSAC
jgi:glyoxylase-like metal-dependent hydrolase (beta-lactamase superfamily II)